MSLRSRATPWWEDCSSLVAHEKVVGRECIFCTAREARREHLARSFLSPFARKDAKIVMKLYHYWELTVRSPRVLGILRNLLV